jgi:hypothetical protein
MKTSVLALDLATTTGWAWHLSGAPRPYFGSFKLPGEAQEVGRAADALERKLRKIFTDTREAGRITHIVFEAQHIASKMNMDTVYKLIVLGGLVEKFAFQVGGIKIYKVQIQEWRKHFIGRGTGFKKTADKKRYLPGEDPKELAVQRAASYGWHTDIADEAEACGILDYFISLMDIAELDHVRPWRDALLLADRERER